MPVVRLHFGFFSCSISFRLSEALPRTYSCFVYNVQFPELSIRASAHSEGQHIRVRFCFVDQGQRSGYLSGLVCNQFPVADHESYTVRCRICVDSEGHLSVVQLP